MEGIAVVFPGQGAQRPGMARDFFQNFPECREVFSAASAAVDRDMEELCFSDCPDLHRTEFTQPALLTAEIAMLSALKKYCGLRPRYFAGHSLGEYTALVAADVLPFELAVKIVRKRGALMQRAVPDGIGAMAALLDDTLDIPGCESMAREAGAEIANYNSPAQVVISGRKQSVETACQSISRRYPSLKAVMLNVSAPFHCSLMRPVEDEFRSFLELFRGSICFDNCGAVLSNFSGTFHTPETLVDSLVSQLSGSVKWISNMRLLSSSASAIYEIGPNRVLGRFFSAFGREVLSIIDVRSMRRLWPEETGQNELQRA